MFAKMFFFWLKKLRIIYKFIISFLSPKLFQYFHNAVWYIWIVAEGNLGGRGSRNAISVHIKQIYVHLFCHEKNHILDKMSPSIPN